MHVMTLRSLFREVISATRCSSPALLHTLHSRCVAHFRCPPIHREHTDEDHLLSIPRVSRCALPCCKVLRERRLADSCETPKFEIPQSSLIEFFSPKRLAVSEMPDK